MLNEWQRKRLIASGVVDRGFATLALLKTSAGSSPWKFHTPLWMAGITSEWSPASVRNGGRFQIGIPAGFRSESVAGFLSECMAGFVGIRSRRRILR